MNDSSVRPTRVLWASVAAGFYVGSRDGAFLGYVDRQPGGAWAAFDASSRAMGEFDDHRAAMESITAKFFAEPITDGTTSGSEIQ